MPKIQYVSSKIIAEFLGLTSRRINQLAAEGVIVAIKENGVNKFDQLGTIQKYTDFLAKKADQASANNPELELRKQKAEVELKEHRAAMVKIQRKELESKMHRSDDVENVFTDLVYTMRSVLLTLPGRLAVDTANAKTAAEASVIIRNEINIALDQLANYKYDPEEFARRLKD